jgi:hypothetical protein
MASLPSPPEVQQRVAQRGTLALQRMKALHVPSAAEVTFIRRRRLLPGSTEICLPRNVVEDTRVLR